MHRLICDKDGWVVRAESYDGWEPHELKGHACAADEIGLAGSTCGALWRSPEGTLHLPDDHKLWQRLRATGLDGPTCVAEMVAIGHLRPRCDGCVPESVDHGVPVPVQPAHVLPNLPTTVGPPGVLVRSATHEDVDRIAAALVENGDQPDEETAWRFVVGEWDNPLHTQIVWEWKDRLMGYEFFHQDENEGLPVSVRTYHLTRQRPHWFWRETWKPVAEGFQALGYTAIQGWVRADLEYWQRSLAKNYGGKVVKRRPHRVTVEYDLATIPFMGWPAKRTVPPLAIAPLTGSRIYLREMEDSERSGVRTWLSSLPRGHHYLKLMDDWCDLDNATCLLILRDGELAGLRVARQRDSTTSNTGWFSPLAMLTLEESQDMARLSRAWHRAAGYTRDTGFIPEDTWVNPKFQAGCVADRLALVAKRTSSYKYVFYEVEIPVTEPEG